MKKSVKIVALGLLLVLFTACNRVPQGDRPLDTATALRMVQTGTQGVETRLLPNAPPPFVYDNNELVALIEVKNRGNHDLKAQDCFVQITGVDTNIIKGGFNIPRSCAETNGGQLQGKNVYNVEGDFNQIEIKSPNVQLPDGVFDFPVNLNVVTCYTYHTTASPTVCVDPLFYQVTAEQKSCIPQPPALGGGQGGPVGVSYVGVSMVGAKAIFEINIQNMGGGRVLSPFTNIQNCGQASLSYIDLDKVAYNVKLSGGTLIDCKPHDKIVRLNNGQGKIVCSFNVPGASAFQTPLLIDLDYGYVNSFQQPLKIVRTPQ